MRAMEGLFRPAKAQDAHRAVLGSVGCNGLHLEREKRHVLRLDLHRLVGVDAVFQ
jgi:hypothetical protein